MLALVMITAAACDDPVRNASIAALGAESPDVPPGPLHRPGQPCLLCHDAKGGDAPLFTVAGTVYLDRGQDPLPDASVQLVDSTGRKFTATTNCAGNFFVTPSDFPVQYPLWVSVSLGEEVSEMGSAVFRDGSCASCHTDPAGPTSNGHIYMFEEPPMDLPASDCR